MMPWQRHVLDVTLEYDPDTGELVYETVVLMVPRQNGKSSLIMAVMFWRLLKFQRQNVVYTAQELKLARKKWKREMLPRLRAVKLLEEGRDYHVATSSGNESIEFFETDSLFTLSAVGEEAGHSDTNHMVVLDEAFAHRSHDVDQGFVPTMSTVWSPQLWVASTAGKKKSVYLNHHQQLGRQAVAEGVTDGVCHIEWSADDECDYRDREVWRQVMPALGHTITEKRIAGFLKLPERDFRRAFLNQTDMGEDEECQKEIAAEVWERQIDPASSIESGAVVGVAVDPDLGFSTLVVAGRRGDGDWHVDHAKTASGTTWVVGAVVEMFGAHAALRSVALDGGGPAAALVPDLEAAGFEVEALSTGKYASACGRLASAVSEGRLWHRGQAEFAGALAEAKTRPLRDLWCWVRANGAESVGALEAGTVALGGAALLVDEPVAAGSPVLERGGLFSWD